MYVGSKSSPVAAFFRGLVLFIAAALVVVPFWMVIMTSFADEVQIGREGGLVFWPQNPSLTAYKAILGGGQVTQALGVSIFVTLVGTGLSLLATTMLAYALSQRQMLFNKFILFMVLLTMLFSAGMIPVYLTVRQVGLLNSVWSLIFPVLISGFNTIVMRAFFMNLPQELSQAARIDGASEMRIFANIVLPLSKPILAAIGLFYAVTYWNVYFSALLYLNDASKWPIQLILRQYLVNQSQINPDQMDIVAEMMPPQPALQMAILVVALVPIAMVYPFLQKHFTKGMLTGAVKG
ncbi:ABC transporter permease [Parenemella sanctibonifatiensis]|uniref:ABC transporter permease n=2 Tax=Parenemella sanctibonifatiensis TaxID=2016505 RepID=A0A255EPC5_9ACTN|nr:ABC transporter permease [Parenemella sanctibonifatiensis]